MFNQVNEQALTLAFYNAGLDRAEAQCLVMEAKLILLFEDLPMEEVIQNLLAKKATEEADDIAA